MVKNKIKSEKNTENKQSFIDLIAKLNEIDAKCATAETELATAVESKKIKSEPKKLVEGSHTHKDMREILFRFNNLFEENIKPILLEEKTVGEYDLAVKTKSTTDGVQVGQWEIKKIIEDKIISYNISDVNSNAIILENINTYVTAAAIVKLLNSGKPVNGTEIASFLRLDESFRINYEDAIRYRKKFLKTGNTLYEDRYDVCKGKALQLKETIKKKSDNLEIL